MVGIKVNSYINFLDNVMKNPKESIREELFQFLENGAFPIHEDGRFSAYKKIKEDWTDIYTGKISHKIGSKPKMNRKDVDDDRTRTCSIGLHFCAFGYLSSYGGSGSGVRVVEVLINPKDVMAIPTDYSFKKGRCATYEVAREIGEGKRIELTEVALTF